MSAEELRKWAMPVAGLLVGVSVPVIAYSVYESSVVIPREQAALEQARLQQEEVASSTAAAEAAQQIAATQAAQKSAQQAAAAKQQAQVAWTNACIAGAKTERDRRLTNVQSVWVMCIRDPNSYASTCNDLKTRIDTETNPALYRKYDEWVGECNRGVSPDLTEPAY